MQGWAGRIAAALLAVAVAAACAQEVDFTAAAGEHHLAADDHRADDHHGGGAPDPYDPNAWGEFPAVGDHIHAAYGVSICGEFLDVAEDFHAHSGIHSHGDDLIHVHPYVHEATGANATLELFLAGSSRIDLEPGALTVDGTTWRDGDACGGEEGSVVVVKWPDGTALGEVEPTVHRDGFDELRFERNLEVYVLAFTDDPASVDLPPLVAAELEAASLDPSS